MKYRREYAFMFGAWVPDCLPEVSPCAIERSSAECLRAFRYEDDWDSELDPEASLEEQFPDISLADISDAESTTDPEQVCARFTG